MTATESVRIQLAMIERSLEGIRNSLARIDALGGNLFAEVNIVPLVDVERKAILVAVERMGINKAAKALGMGKTTVYRKLAQYRAEKEKVA